MKGVCGLIVIFILAMMPGGHNPLLDLASYAGGVAQQTHMLVTARKQRTIYAQNLGRLVKSQNCFPNYSKSMLVGGTNCMAHIEVGTKLVEASHYLVDSKLQCSAVLNQLVRDAYHSDTYQNCVTSQII